ncbi:nucleoside 2-deoxyribosyltransferase [Alcaligenaceae bacterium C4P045]|nr:nucleoside 2-deoxyribosyltransferase [Alcaligenaceae bacterium C4P045]
MNESAIPTVNGVDASARAAPARPTVYLAGFDVFRPDAVAWGERLKAACAEHGFEGLYPLDNAAPADVSGPALAEWIYEGNVALIRQADAVLANVNAFRGYEPDSGTAFEIGYAAALGKPVWMYMDGDAAIVDQVPGRPDPRDAHRTVDAEGYTIEDFGLPRNLMLACAGRIVPGDVFDCLAAMARSGTLGR